jgi:ketosteroid isomerase-like protein
LQSREIRVSGEIAYEWGLFQETFTPKKPGADTPPIALDGKFLRIYHRQPNGQWKLARASWSNNHP